LHSTLI